MKHSTRGKKLNLNSVQMYYSKQLQSFVAVNMNSLHLLTKEAGKPWNEADADTAEAIDFLEYLWASNAYVLKDGIPVESRPGEYQPFRLYSTWCRQLSSLLGTSHLRSWQVRQLLLL